MLKLLQCIFLTDLCELPDLIRVFLVIVVFGVFLLIEICCFSCLKVVGRVSWAAYRRCSVENTEIGWWSYMRRRKCRKPFRSVCKSITVNILELYNFKCEWKLFAQHWPQIWPLELLHGKRLCRQRKLTISESLECGIRWPIQYAFPLWQYLYP